MILNAAGAAPDPPFNPSDKFSGGEDGAWFHPQDITSLFTANPNGRDAGAWTTAVTDRVGVMVNKKDLGLAAGSTVADYLTSASELLTNADITSDTGWTKSSGVTFSSGAYDFDGTASESISQAAIVSHNVWYVAEVVVSSYTSGTARIIMGNGANGASPYDINAAGTFTFFYLGSVSGNGDFYIEANTSGPFLGSIGSASVKELDGDHVWANNDTNRGTLRQDGNSIYYVEFDSAEYMSTVTGVTSIFASDTVVICAFLANDDTQYASAWAQDGTTRINFGNNAAGTAYEQTIYDFTTKIGTGWNDSDDNTLNIWEVYMDDTDNEVTIDKNNVSEQTATSFGSAWGSGTFRVANANNASQPLDCEWYGLIAYEGTSFDQDVYDWMEEEVGLAP